MGGGKKRRIERRTINRIYSRSDIIPPEELNCIDFFRHQKNQTIKEFKYLSSTISHTIHQCSGA